MDFNHGWPERCLAKRQNLAESIELLEGAYGKTIWSLNSSGAGHTSPDSNDDTFVLLERWIREVPCIPVSILSNPTTFHYDDLVRKRDLGAEIFTVALDVVTPKIFNRPRGRGMDRPHNREKYWRTLEWAAGIHGPEKFDAHLICGMGGTHQLRYALANPAGSSISAWSPRVSRC